MKPVRVAQGVQRGAALVLVAALLAGGTAWMAVELLSRVATGTTEKEMRSAIALARAKQALLAYVAHYAARADHQVPGRLPCPEPLAPPAGQEGVAASLGCLGNAQTYIGRFPWRTLGVEQIRDGHAEPLWYVLGPGFRAPPINFDSVGRLTLDGKPNAAVALIIAPGAPLDTLLVPESPPSGCARRNQSALRYPRPFTAFDPAQFLDCGNATGFFSSLGSGRWFNDRVMVVSAAELMDAIAGPLQDRLQRVLAPAIDAWDANEFASTGRSWRVTHGAAYLPFASPFGNPAANAFCGSAGRLEGLPPVAPRGAGCDTAWRATPAPLAGLADPTCVATIAEVRCSFRAVGDALPAARISAIAPHVAGSFRGTIAAADIGLSHGGGATLALKLSAATGEASATIELGWPMQSAGTVVSVTLPQLPDSRLLADPRLAWFFNNQWYRHLHYAAAPAALVEPGVTCVAPGDSGCVTVNGLAPSTGAATGKRLVLALMGRALPNQSRSCSTDTDGNGIADCEDPAQYLEAENAVFDDRRFRADLRVPNPAALAQPWPAFNDRLAVCPLYYTRHNGTQVQVCG